MRKRYEVIMEHITVTDEMRRRILANIQSPASPRRGRPTVRKMLAAAACLVLILAGAALLPRSFTGETVVPLEQATPELTECASAGELSDAVGFPVSDLSVLPFEATEVSYLSLWGELAQIQYLGAEEQAVFRKSAGTGDNSGDYNRYETAKEISVRGNTVTLKGNGGYCLAVWSDGTYAYSLSLSFELPAEQWSELVAAVR